MEEKYSVGQLTINTLLNYINNREIAIPEIQRPFRWHPWQVRDLIDSLYKGYPVGYIITWQNSTVRLKDGSSSMGKRIIIDGQQRITALKAAISGEEVKDDKYKNKRIVISFNPITEEFKTKTSSTEKGREWIADISEVMKDGYDILTLVDDYCVKNEGIDRHALNTKILRLINIKNKSIGEIQLSQQLDIDIVNEIFIRINSSGTSLNSADFAMSKIAVYEKHSGDEMGMLLRKFIDYFAFLSVDPSGYGEIIKNDQTFSESVYLKHVQWLRSYSNELYAPKYSDIIRVVGLVQFKRGKVSDIVALLAGRNFETRQYEKTIEDESFAKLEAGLIKFANETRYKQFIESVLLAAGYSKKAMITSINAINYAYAMYLHLHDLGENHAQINSWVRRLLVISLLTGRHSGSFESQFEQDIKRIAQKGDMERFINNLEVQELSDIFWKSTLVDEFNKPTANNQFWNLFVAAQNKALFSSFLSKSDLVRDLDTDQIHHIFPKDYLIKNGYEKNMYNRIANYVYLKNDINVAISNRCPKDYLNQILTTRNAFHSNIIQERDLIENLEESAIPNEILHYDYRDYERFLLQRQALMAKMVRKYYQSL